MMNTRKPLLFILCALFFVPLFASAKDLTNRLGVGFKNQFHTDLPAIAAQYYPQPELGFSAALGLQTESDNSKFGIMFKLYKVIFPEDKMNFFMGAGAGLLSSKILGQNDSGFELNGFCGGEFFLPELESLGISFETGIAITSLANGVSFRTTADTPARAGIIFYF